MKFKNFKASVRGGLPHFLGLAAILLFVSQASWALTLRDLINLSRQYTADSAYLNSQPRLTDARIVNFLNEGQKYASGQTWAFVKRTTFMLQAGATEYFVPEDFQTSVRLTVDGVKVYQQTLDSLDSAFPSWESVSGAPRYYYVRTATRTVVGFYPSPTVNSTGTVTLDYNTVVRPMGLMDDVPFNGTTEFYPFHETLAKFVAYRYFLLVGNVPAADIWAKEFATDIKRMTDVPRIMPDYRPGIVIDR